ncbi:MAG: glutamate-1-semialdehyde 2,1-aminomutase [Desulfurococcales archaeon]|nr:glutamate-1-semialdehyde 2,1-aminomutase [Desulfurococcales archaeon]
MPRDSRALFEEALRVFPGGVNSPVRALVKPYPFYVARAEGPYLYTVEGRRLLDMVLAYGPLILGHRDRRVLEAVSRQLSKGWLYGAPYEAEIELAKTVLRHYKPGGMARFVNSGTEATMTAIRLARGFTKRKYIVKFDGCYHGAHDQVLVAAGSAMGEYGLPSSEGVLEEVARYTLVADFNDEPGVDRLVSRLGDEIAAIIVEPVMANSGVIPGKPGFLKTLRQLADERGFLLIFDEVVTGFRLGLKGAQGYYGIEADLVVLGKVVGGGFPVGAVVGKREVMENLTPMGRVFNAGTFNAHPVTVVAGLATLRVLETTDAIEKAARAMEFTAKLLDEAAEDAGIPHYVTWVGSMGQIFFTGEEVDRASKARRSDKRVYSMLHEILLQRGVFIAPSQLEALFTSSSHTGEALELLADSIPGAFREVRRLVAGENQGGHAG